MSRFISKSTAVGTLFALASNIAVAEEDNVHIARCNLTEAPEARIRCLENVVRQLSEITNVTISASGADSVSDARESRSSSAEISTAVRALANTDKEREKGVATTSPERASSERVGDVPETASPTAVTSTTGAQQSATSSELDSFGEEQVTSRKESNRIGSRQRLPAQVVAFDFVGRDKLRARLENGQIWRQSNSDRPNLYRYLRNKDDFPIELWKTSRGSYRMHIPDANKTIRVERVK